MNVIIPVGALIAAMGLAGGSTAPKTPSRTPPRPSVPIVVSTNFLESLPIAFNGRFFWGGNSMTGDGTHTHHNGSYSLFGNHAGFPAAIVSAAKAAITDAEVVLLEEHRRPLKAAISKGDTSDLSESSYDASQAPNFGKRMFRITYGRILPENPNRVLVRQSLLGGSHIQPIHAGVSQSSIHIVTGGGGAGGYFGGRQAVHEDVSKPKHTSSAHELGHSAGYVIRSQGRAVSIRGMKAGDDPTYDSTTQSFRSAWPGCSLYLQYANDAAMLKHDSFHRALAEFAKVGASLIPALMPEPVVGATTTVEEPPEYKQVWVHST